MRMHGAVAAPQPVGAALPREEKRVMLQGRLHICIEMRSRRARRVSRGQILVRLFLHFSHHRTMQ